MVPEREWIDRARKLVESLHVPDLVQAGVLLGDDRFMPVITYPPVTMYPRMEPEELLGTDGMPGGEGPRAVYAHIPFCPFKCHYCHWVKKVNAPEEEVDSYLDLLDADLDINLKRLGVDAIPASSVLVGGGTPTYPTVAQLGRFLEAFTRKVDLSACRQFSFEAEPASITGPEGLEKLKILASYGVDRISLGVQSFDDHVLKAMGRVHTGEEAEEAVRQIRRAGIGSISIDLIYGYQDQSLEDWIHTLDTALASGVDAWHLYRLRIQRHGDVQGKVLGRYKEQRERFPGLDEVRLMKALGLVFSVENGRDQHFTRIFSRDRSHVTQYMWDYCCDLKDVIGLGISSWANHWRTFTLNVGGNFNRYRDMVTQGRLPVDRGLVRDAETDARRSLISPLKNDAVHKGRFTARTGMDPDEHFGGELSRLEGLGLLTRDDRFIRLTPRGRFFADETVMQLFQKRYLPFEDLAHPLMSD